MSTKTILDDPIWSTLQECNRFSLVVRQCFVTAEHKGQLRQRAKAICVPAEDTDRVLPNAFSHVPDLRHVLVEPGIQTIGESAWQSCQQLQIVKMPATVVCLQDGAFQGRYALKMVLVPGCKRFGRRVFAECCSLSQKGTTDNAITQATYWPHKPKSLHMPLRVALHFRRSALSRQRPMPRTARDI